MPFDKALYHPDWKWISKQIRAQADNRCEVCGAPNGATVIRNRHAPEQFHVIDEWAGEMAALDGEWVVKIVLTVAHLCHDPRCIDPTHLRALCQLHHLRHDADHHARNAAATRRKQRQDAGQLTLEAMTA